MLNPDFGNELRVIGLKFREIEQSAPEALDPLLWVSLLQAVETARKDGEWRKTQFNLFEVLGRTHLELAHSSFLAWLLDPLESHGFGNKFLVRFMQSSGINEKPSTADLTVSREFQFSEGRFDIHVSGAKWCLVVENKIYATLSHDQCARYQRYCEGLTKPGYDAWLTYVTPNERPPSGHYWLPYGKVREILEELLGSSQSSPASPAIMAVEQFCEHISAHFEV